jgi:uncharacterized membrane protein YgaE (UPF0421/DUF939 family)
MRIIKELNFLGGRIVKTGIAVLVTALICHLFNWPAMFAVVSAIVTIEPTAADSIKKAYIRFPATAIGAAFSVLYTFLFGDEPFSYAFVALSTIIACNKLRLHEGTLVATLTGVVMITTVHEHYLSSFIVRLLTTSTGLIVSSLVNIFVLPPNYSLSISSGINSLYKKAGEILVKRGMELVKFQPNKSSLYEEFQKLVKELENINRLCLYQKDEWKFHRVNREDIRKFRYEYKKLTILRQVIHHIGNLIYLPTHQLSLQKNKAELITSSIQSIKLFFSDPYLLKNGVNYFKNTELRELFFEQKSLIPLDELPPDQHHHISPETAILYELLSIYDLTEEFSKIHSLEQRNKKLLKSGQTIDNSF